MRVIGPDGKTFIAYADPDELERHMKELSPADARLIEGFCGAIRQFAHFDHPETQIKPRSLMGLQDSAAFGWWRPLWRSLIRLSVRIRCPETSPPASAILSCGVRSPKSSAGAKSQ